jgi:hypothetical protein
MTLNLDKEYFLILNEVRPRDFKQNQTDAS